MVDLVQTKPKPDMISSHSTQWHPQDRAAPTPVPCRLWIKAAKTLDTSLPCSDGLTATEAWRRVPPLGTGLRITPWSYSHRCRDSGTASVRLLFSQSLSWMSQTQSQRTQTHQSPELPAPFAGSERLPTTSSRPLSAGEVSSSPGAGSARCWNSPTPPRGAPQDEEEPLIPSPLLLNSDFAGELEEKKVSADLARRRGAGPCTGEQGNTSGKLPGVDETRGKMTNQTVFFTYT